MRGLFSDGENECEQLTWIMEIRNFDIVIILE